MASDLSSGCAEGTDVVDEKEEGEISLEDVSSSEEGHLGYGFGSRGKQCTNCFSMQHSTVGCSFPPKFYCHRGQPRRDAVHGKENRHYAREQLGHTGGKHAASTLQEKNDDLVPISSDSDMEIVNSVDGSVQTSLRIKSKGKTKKKRKRKKSHAPIHSIDDLGSSSSVDIPERVSTACSNILAEEDVATKGREFGREFGKRIHRREFSPVRRSVRSRLAARSPPAGPPSSVPHPLPLHVPSSTVIPSSRRYRSPARPRSRSPFERVRSPPTRRSPRRLKSSPKRSPRRSPASKKPVHSDATSVAAREYTDGSVEKLLKKVRRLDAVGTYSLKETLNKNKEHASSLKEKLMNMMKAVRSDNNGNVVASRARDREAEKATEREKERGSGKDGQEQRQERTGENEKSNTEAVLSEATREAANDADEEEDLALLRQKALETKQKKTSPQNESTPNEPAKGSAADLNDDQDEEDLQLRMIALRSAVLKKHRDRVERRGRRPAPDRNGRAARSDSPFTQSFLDSIPIPGEELLSFASPPCTPPAYNDTDHAEDMDLDTDVEREKEKLQLPYSPTDKITVNISVDTELLGIEPSDVSFMGLDEPNNVSLSASFHPADRVEEHGRTTSFGRDLELGDASNVQPDYVTNPSTLAIVPPGNLGDPPETDRKDDVRATAREDASPPDHPRYAVAIPKRAPPTLHQSAQSAQPSTEEPLYMHGLPDVTKDANKIPTLINKTLVPAPVLKSNKQLQQPLSTRRHEQPLEPAFRNARMQPVPDVQTDMARTAGTFKPIRFPSLVQKNPVLLKPPVAFDDSLTDDIASVASPLCPSDAGGSEPRAIEGQLTDFLLLEHGDANSPSIVPKKRKVPRKGVRRKPIVGNAAPPFVGGGSEAVGIGGYAACDKAAAANQGPASEFLSARHVNGVNVAEANDRGCPHESTRSGHGALGHDTDKDRPVDTATFAKMELGTIEPDSAVGTRTMAPENRRQSLDEDEDALRASLLASLPKRGRVPDSEPCRTSTTKMTPAASEPRPRLEFESPTGPLSDPAIRTNARPSIKESTEFGDERNENSLTIPVESPGRILHLVERPLATDLARKKPALASKGPQRKFQRKAPIAASTRVVNNAKRYQNNIIQKRLNLRKVVVTNCNTGQKIAVDGQSAGNMQSANERQWPVNTNTKAKTSILASESQRIVINLQSDTESDSDSERRAKKVRAEKARASANLAADFERNLDKFLRDVRKKQESVAASRPTATSAQTPKASKSVENSTCSASLHTPLAVRHLPASQQEEYRRLKQQILEREKLRQRRAAESASSKEAARRSVESTRSSHCALSKDTKSSSASSDVSGTNRESGTTAIGPTAPVLSSDSATDAPNTAHFPIRACTENPVPRGDGWQNGLNDSPRVPNEDTSTPRDETVKVQRLPCLKVLTGTEINRKYAQDQAARNASSGTGFSDGTASCIVDNFHGLRNGGAAMSRSYDTRASDSEIKNFFQNVERELVENDESLSTRPETLDSDASTVVVTRDGNPPSGGGCLDASDTTIVFSERESFAETPSEHNSTSNSSRIIDPCTDGRAVLNIAYTSDERRENAEGSWSAAKKDAKAALSALNELSSGFQEQHLKSAEQKLVMKRYMILDELAEMSSNLRQWLMERDLQACLVAEVRKLREQLRVAEERLRVQHNRIKTIGPKVIAAHKKVNAERQECFKISKICSALGTKTMGKDYKVPDAGMQLLESRLKEVASHTRQLSRKRVRVIGVSGDSVSELTDAGCVPEGFAESHTLENLGEGRPNTTARTNGEYHNDRESRETDDVEATGFSKSLDNTKLTERSNCGERPRSRSQFSEGEAVTEQEAAAPMDAGFDVEPGQTNASEVSNKRSRHDPVLPMRTITNRTDGSHQPLDSTAKTGFSNKVLVDDQYSSKKPGVAPYVSILTHLSATRNENPNGVLCPFELMGTCSDGECRFVHQSEGQAN